MSLTTAAEQVERYCASDNLPMKLFLLSQLCTGQAHICPVCQWFTAAGTTCLCSDEADA